MKATFIVPRGAEYAAVKAGSKALVGETIPIPIGKQVFAYLSKNMPIGTNPIVLWGLCGSLAPHLGVGSVVVCQSCLFEEQSLACAPDLTQELGQQLACPVVNCYTADRVVHRIVDKQALYKTTNCSIVDMEGYFILKALSDRAVGMVRVVSDDLTADLPDLTQSIDGQGNLNYLALAWCFLQHPLGAVHVMGGSLRGLHKLRSVVSKYLIGCSEVIV